MAKAASLQRQAEARLNDLYEQLHSWRRVGEATGLNPGQAWKIRYGKMRASKSALQKLRLEKTRTRRIPWKKKYLLLRKYLKKGTSNGCIG